MGKHRKNESIVEKNKVSVKVIPQYCTAHPVHRIITQQNIMAAFSPESSHARKMGVWKGMVGKKRWKFVAKKEKKTERKC